MEELDGIEKFVGLDVGQEEMEAVWLSKNGDGSKGSISISNNHEGYEELLSKLKEFSKQGQAPAVGVESHDGYLSPLNEYLGDEGITLVSINPIRVRRYKDMLGQQKKTDNYDAYAIADFLKSRKNQLENLPKFKPRTQRLKKLSRTQTDLKKQVNRYTSKLIQVLDEYLPELVQLEEFPNLTSITGLSIVSEYPTPDKLAEVGKNELTNLIQEVSNGQYGKDTALAIQNKVKSINRAPSAVEVYGLRAKILSNLLLDLRKSSKQVKAKIASLLEGWETAQILKSLPGVGDLLAGRFLGEIVSIHKFKSADALALYCGVAPIPHSSGSWKSNRTTERVNKEAKDALMQMAHCSKQNGEESKEYYQKKRDEGKNHWHAIKCLARQLVRVIYAMLRDRTYYDPGK